MNLTSYESKLSDEELVRRSQEGKSEAFGALVERHKSAACGVAYAVCGDFAASEDLAQDAFVSAWKQLPGIRDAARFRSWLCGIARNLALGQVRKRRRRGDNVSGDSLPEQIDGEALPHDAAISVEESALLWTALLALPETYREPLVLFYREQQSVTAVASALGLSEETVRQRLSRGRAMLRDELSKKIEYALGRSRPSAAFTLGVMSALPPLAIGFATSATAVTAKAATGGSGAVATTGGMAGLGAAGLFLQGTLGLFGLYVLFKYMKALRLPKAARNVLLKALGFELLVTLAFAGFLVWFAYNEGRPFEGLSLSPAALAAIAVGLFMASVSGLAIRADRKLRGFEFYSKHQLESRRRYESKWKLGGFPLVSIAFGGDPERAELKGVARGWIAVGDVAIGAIALGGVAIGPLAIGGACVGLVSLGGMAIGGLSLGGVAAGAVACGGMAVAWKYAIGGMAVSGDLAIGGLAIASERTLGGEAIAPLTSGNLLPIQESELLGYLTEYGPYASWLALLAIPALIIGLRRIRKMEQELS